MTGEFLLASQYLADFSLVGEILGNSCEAQADFHQLKRPGFFKESKNIKINGLTPGYTTSSIRHYRELFEVMITVAYDGLRCLLWQVHNQEERSVLGL